MKKGTWYFRYQVPFLYRPYFDNRREIKKSLRTSDKMLASIKALKLEVIIKEQIMAIKQKLTSDTANELIAMYAGNTLAKIECAMDPMSELSQAYMQIYLDRVNADPELSSEEINAYMSPIDNLFDSSTSIESQATSILKSFDIAVSEPIGWSTKFALTQVLNLAQSAQASLKSNDIAETQKITTQLEKVLTTSDPTYSRQTNLSDSEPAQAAQAVVAPTPPKDTRSIRELYLEYQEEQKLAVKPRTLQLVKSKAYAVSELLNEMPASSITRRDAVKVRDLLFSLPSNVNKKAVFKGLSLIEAIDKNASLPEPLPCLDNATVKDYLQKLSSLFIWAERHKYVDDNPFESLKTQSKSKAKSDLERRHPFSEDMLKKLFSTPIYQQNKMHHSYQYWLPVLALYSGARQNELAQLFKGNIIEVNDVWCFKFSPVHDTQDFKTDASERITPIHPNLIKLGFLDFVNSCEEHLFETGLPFYSGKGYAKEASRWFNETYKQKLGIKTSSGYDFHSFRHTVINYYKQHTNVEERFVQALVGHKHGSITFDRYGAEFDPTALREYINMLQWEHILTIEPFDMSAHTERTQLRLEEKARREARKEYKNKSQPPQDKP